MQRYKQRKIICYKNNKQKETHEAENKLNETCIWSDKRWDESIADSLTSKHSMAEGSDRWSRKWFILPDHRLLLRGQFGRHDLENQLGKLWE